MKAETPKIETRVELLMRGAGCSQWPDGSWVATTGPMSTITGHGQTCDAALTSLRKKITRVVRRQAD